jgi:hypothetical protein
MCNNTFKIQVCILTVLLHIHVITSHYWIISFFNSSLKMVEEGRNTLEVYYTLFIIVSNHSADVGVIYIYIYIYIYRPIYTVTYHTAQYLDNFKYKKCNSCLLQQLMKQHHCRYNEGMS